MIIQSENVWIDGAFQPAQIAFEERIIEIRAYGETKADADYGALRVVPGFVDAHCHGAYGADTNDADPEGLRLWAKRIPEEGTTSFLATTVTAPDEIIDAALRNVARVTKEQTAGKDGARILGVHLEGPFLSKQYPGAQPVQDIVPPSVELFQKWMRAANDQIRIVTLAPEEDHDFALTRYAADRGVVVSIGHSAATYEQGLEAVEAGARSVTHTFNAQSPFSHRNGGVAGLALSTRDLYSEIICDCAHVHPEALRVFFACKGNDRGVMVSDALRCKGMEAGATFRFASQDVTIGEDGAARLSDGTIAGSTMRMNEGLRNLVEKAGVKFDQALNACTRNPAGLLRMDDELGAIAKGYYADIVVLEDDYRVRDVFCAGIRQGT